MKLELWNFDGKCALILLLSCLVPFVRSDPAGYGINNLVLLASPDQTQRQIRMARSRPLMI